MNSQMHDVVHDGPRLHVHAVDLYHVVVDPMKEETERLDHHQHPHQVVDLEHRVSAGTLKGLVCVYVGCCLSLTSHHNQGLVQPISVS